MSDELKDMIGRALWTFAQAFFAAVLVAKSMNLDAIQAAAIAGLSAALSVGKTGVVHQVKKRRQNPPD